MSSLQLYTVYSTRKPGHYAPFRSMPVDARPRKLESARRLLASISSRDFPAWITPLGSPTDVMDYRTGVTSL